jgi:hypothetical protein
LFLCIPFQNLTFANGIATTAFVAFQEQEVMIKKKRNRK